MKQNKIILIIVTCFLWSCNQSSEINNLAKKIDIETIETLNYDKDVEQLDSLLKDSSLAFKFKKTIKPEDVPLTLVFNKRLVESKYIGNAKCYYEKWTQGNNFFDFWTIEFNHQENEIITKARIDSVCNSLPSIKTSYQKKFRGHKMYSNKLVLFTNNLFSEEEQEEYKALIDFIAKDFFCW